MSQNQRHNYSGTCARLADVIRELDVSIRVSEKNEQLRDTYTEQLKRHERNIDLCTAVIELLKPMIDDTQTYINKRREEAMLSINNALRMAGEIIPDADDGIRIQLDGDEAYVTTADGRTVQNTEGGAFRHISSTFLQAIMLTTNPDLLRTIMLDEMFAQVNAENTAKLSLYLAVLSQDMQVICIEQKPEIKSNVDTLAYIFKKGEQFAEVTRQFMKAGADIGSASEVITDGSQINGVVQN
ncbi:MAG: hypothetical protein NC548_30745 [Lachnospiraceae bacterium]|nr:hypothetical protein [Lachnospiraceae bacterium]